MQARVEEAARLVGSPRLPGDKSISHRALLLGAIAEGTSRVEGLSQGADVESTASCLRALGVHIESGRVHGVGLHGLRRSTAPLDCGNSGTTMRLLAGLLAGQPFQSVLVGDESLSRRPMDRIAEPLRRMGAHASLNPLTVGGTLPLHGVAHELKVASAQVKSAILLAGLYAEGSTSVSEPSRSRDHTELMLVAMGVRVVRSGLTVTLTPPRALAPLDLTVPRDLSAAAFWLVAAGIRPGSRIRLAGVGVNPTRAHLLGVLRGLGLQMTLSNERRLAAEPVADLDVWGPLTAGAMNLGPEDSAALIDELPVLAVAATALPGRSSIRGARELRVKESDRVRSMAEGLRAMGADIEEMEDGWTITGGRRLHGARLASFGDHRVAMALAVAALQAEGTTEIDGAECVEISYPGFWEELEALCGTP